MLDANSLHSWELTWKPNRGPIKTTVLSKGGYMGFHVSFGECIYLVGFQISCQGFESLR